MRDAADRLDRDYVNDAGESYIDTIPLNDGTLDLMARVSKGLDAEQPDYGSLLDGEPNPSLRDQEYLQHSSLWGRQFVSGGAGEGPHRTKPQIKTDATLPAYCNPPNPCPVGYTEEQGCTTDFENTAAFSREYQEAQDCMCDQEHMLDCDAPGGEGSEDTEFKKYLTRQFQQKQQPIEHKNLVAKKFFQKKSDIYQHKSSPAINPFLTGEKLPIAAKKGFRLN